ncbi:MAG: SOS response-associated peptidase [Candidatus Nanopelagicales bacterium]
MCGRYALPVDKDALGIYYEAWARDTEQLATNFNVAPTTSVYVIDEKGEQRKLRVASWGLIPRWAKDASMQAKMINARSETAAEKPSFRDSFKESRCIIPAIGWYEWQRSGPSKVPYFHKLPDEQFVSMAGLLSAWKNPTTEEWLFTCAILTRSAIDELAYIHDRMPVLLRPNDFTTWLRGNESEAQEIIDFDPPRVQAHKVSQMVNATKNNNESLLEPVE